VKQKFKQLVENKFAIPALLFLLVILAYGLLIPSMGFYWDDWPFAWYLKFFGPAEFIAGFKPFRPLLGPIFELTTSIFGGHPLTWQILGLVVRFLLGLEIWSLLRQVWPSRKSSALWVVLIFTVYPAYGQQWVALTHVNQELIPLLFLLSSFIITIGLLRNNRTSIALTVLALVLQALGLFSTEYFFGLEILRFLFIFVILSETISDKKDLLKNAGWGWLPYLAVWILNAVWTYNYHNSSAYNSYGLSAFSSSTLSPVALINEFISTLSLSGFSAWLGTFNVFASIDGSTTQVIAFTIFSITTVFIFFFMQGWNQEQAAGNENGNTKPGTLNPKPETRNLKPETDVWLIVIGLVAIFAGRLPSWAAGLPLKIEFDYDRFFVSIMLGASLFIVGLAGLTLREGRAKLIFLSILVGMSTAYQFTVANTYRRDWANQRDFFWQLAWRIPNLQPNTALLTYELPLVYVSDLQLTAPLNWIYAPDLKGRDLPYVLLYLKTRFSPTQIHADQPLDITYRTVIFKGNTSNSVVIYKQANGCLRVLDPIYNSAETVPGASFYLTDAIALSNPGLIDAEAPTPNLDKTLFGAEPSHGWCYFYTQAEIARQKINWAEVINLYQQAQKKGYNPLLPVENLPFIEAFAMTGDDSTAAKLTERTAKAQPTLCPALSTLWKRIEGENNPSPITDNILSGACSN